MSNDLSLIRGGKAAVPVNFALVGAADFNAADFARRAEAGAFDAVVAIDGGYAFLREAGFVPDVALGDFDSLGFVPDGIECEIYNPHKDESDLELALGLARDRGATRVTVYGCLARRLDHTLAALQVLAREAEAGMRVAAVTAEFEVNFLVGPAVFDVPQPLFVPTEAAGEAHSAEADCGSSGAIATPADAASDAGAWRGVVSVFALTPEARGVTEHGMEYPLENATLSNRTSLGLSNELVGQPARIEVVQGTLVVLSQLTVEQL